MKIHNPYVMFKQHATRGKLSNGIYRIVLKVFAEEDPVGFVLIVNFEAYNRLGEANFLFST